MLSPHVAQSKLGYLRVLLGGPILFLAYINDLLCASDFFKTIIFADDTVASQSGNSVESIIQSVNTGTELPAIQNWLLRNKLSLNVNKSHAVIYSTSHVNRQVHSIVLCDDLIPISTNVKYLGVFIDSKLNFKYIIDQIVAKVAKIVGIFHRIGGQVPYHLMLNLYYSLVYPRLQYCNLIWGCAPNSYTNKILMLQKRSYVSSLRASI